MKYTRQTLIDLADFIGENHDLAIASSELIVKMFEQSINDASDESRSVQHNEAEREFINSIKELDQLLFEISQVFDGWHTDVVWSDYDEKVRQRIIDYRMKYTFNRIIDK